MAKKTPAVPGADDLGQDAAPEMTAADAAKLVSREVPVLNKDGKPSGETKQAAVKASEVLSFRDYGDTVVVVTTDGQKLTGEKAVK